MFIVDEEMFYGKKHKITFFVEVLCHWSCK